ncbi:uncharacterized protein TM35_000017310 [Trypanosoma theileri]|uniref:Uncharacterized protein n=1 Tax=Trypanosoma theileri TaxID=67003 RepID=A0A1X0PA88_9TRYP|nr:uncharacterized protein TM35_000017310 [Trypanosoma theileri]ORC93854.1 hypothetical protein TM35_000017310 [Trypanosoma theileri]
MDLGVKQHSYTLKHYLLDKKEIITDKCILRQLTHFAHMQRLGSPLWLSWELAAGLNLTLRHMQSPLNIWYPLMGESFFPLVASSHFSEIILRKCPVTQIVNVSERSTLSNSTTKCDLVLSSSACSDGKLHWCSVPETLKHLFIVPKKSIYKPFYNSQYGGHLRPLGLWVSTVVLKWIKVAPEMPVMIHTPSSFMCVVNADQLYPSTILAEKELECLLLQLDKKSTFV